MSTATRSSMPTLPAPARTAVVALGVQSVLALGYLGLTDAGVTAPTMLAVPFVWITAAVVAVRHVERPTASRLGRWLAAGVGVAYALGLAWLTGTVGPAMGEAGIAVVTLPPGWGPVVRISAGGIVAQLLPYRVVGVVALGYLVSLSVRNVVDEGLTIGVGGIVALGSCAGCALPLLASVTGTLGGAGLGTVSVGGGTYLLGTAAYLLAVWVLAARPFRRYSSR
ncbi:MAG: DUF7546 family protein [Halolamina sp.]